MRVRQVRDCINVRNMQTRVGRRFDPDKFGVWPQSLSDLVKVGRVYKRGLQAPTRIERFGQRACAVVDIGRRDQMIAGRERVQHTHRRRLARSKGRRRRPAFQCGAGLFKGGAVGIAAARIEVLAQRVVLRIALEGC